MDLTEFYEEHKDFIEGCANTISRKYGCRNILEDLVSAGAMAFLEHIGGYDEKQGAAVTTFLHPYIMGAMKREAEKNFSAFSLSRREFEQIRKEGALTQARGVSLDGPDGKGLAELIPSREAPVEREVYTKICLEHLQAAFESLSFREREILGGFFGVYGHKEQTLAEIGEAFQIKENSARKSKDRALDKLRKLCEAGELGRWRSIHAAIREFQRECAVERGDLGRCTVPDCCEEIE